MKMNEIVKGGYYTAKVSNRITIVRVDAISENNYGFRKTKATNFYVTNMRTKKALIFRSAQRFRRKVSKNEIWINERKES